MFIELLFYLTNEEKVAIVGDLLLILVYDEINV